VIAFIMIAAIFGFASPAKTLEELQKSRDALIVEVEKSNPSDVEAALSQELNEILLLDSEAGQEGWLSFFLNKDQIHPFMKDAGSQGLTAEQVLEKRVDELVNRSLAPIKSAEFEERKAYMCEGKGYENQARYIVREFFSLLRQYLVARLHNRIQKKNAGQVSGSDNLDLNTIYDYFRESLNLRLYDYVDECDKSTEEPRKNESPESKANREAVRLNNAKIELSNVVLEQLTHDHQFFIENDFVLLGKTQNYLNNVIPHTYTELEYLVALVEASPEKLPALRSRIESRANILIRAAHAGHMIRTSNDKLTALTFEDISTKWAFQAFEALSHSGKNSRQAVGEIFGLLMKLLADKADPKIALSMAKNIYLYRVNGGLSFGQGYIAKASIEARPFSHTFSNSQTEAIRSWDHITEMSADEEEALHWFVSISAHYKDILVVSQDALATLNFFRRVFSGMLLKGTETKFYATLYQVLVEFLASGASLDRATLAQNIDQFIDAHYSTNAYYILLKIHVINMITNDGYTIHFKGVSNEIVGETANLLEQPQFNIFANTILKAHKSLIPVDTKKGTPKKQIDRLEAILAKIQENADHDIKVSSESFNIITKPGNKII